VLYVNVQATAFNVLMSLLAVHVARCCCVGNIYPTLNRPKFPPRGAHSKKRAY